jgi:lipopolysaccharide/colanic/teichoic acid biosynthesis glycosyltransferase
VLIGDREGNDRVLRLVLRHPDWGLDVVYSLCVEEGHTELDWLDGAEVERTEPIEGADGEGFAARIASVAGDLEVDRVVLTGASASLSERTRLARLLTEGGHCVDYVCGEPETLYAAAVLHHLEGLPVLTVQPTRLSRGSAAMKRGLDLAISSVGLVTMSPLFAIAAIAIKLGSPGPVFFRQPRIGWEGREFNAVKFRTMVDGADAMRADVRQQSMHANGEGLLKLRDDPRITRVGARLRRWSIDELPQLWNVLRGDMSLVGPRPLPLDEAPLVRGHFELRMRVRPGITGTWQTHGRSDIPFEDMVKLDYTYVACWSLREDLRLLLRTAAVVAQGRGTY